MKQIIPKPQAAPKYKLKEVQSIIYESIKKVIFLCAIPFAKSSSIKKCIDKDHFITKKVNTVTIFRHGVTKHILWYNMSLCGT